MPKKYIFALKNRIVNPVKEILVIDNENMKGEVMCYPITDHNPDKNKCPFLVPEEQRESVLAGYKSAINKLTSPAAC